MGAAMFVKVPPDYRGKKCNVTNLILLRNDISAILADRELYFLKVHENWSMEFYEISWKLYMTCLSKKIRRIFVNKFQNFS